MTNSVKSKPVRDSKGRFLKSNKTGLTSGGTVISNIVNKPKQLTNVIFINLDASGSMSGLGNNVVTGVNLLLGKIKEEAKKTGQKTLVGVKAFGIGSQSAISTLVSLRPVDQVEDIKQSQYLPYGNTPLNDSIFDIIQEADPLTETDNDLSVLVQTFTDGQENASRKIDKEKLKQLISEKQATDRWTFAFTGPVGSKRTISNAYGIFEGNIEEWEQTLQGWNTASASNSVGVSSYYASRASGQTASRQFFANVPSAAKVKSALKNLQHEFVCWVVDQEGQISDFINRKLAAKSNPPSYLRSYEKGRGYYKLNKPSGEKVQPYKRVLVRNRVTGEIFGGQDARELLGISNPGEIIVKAGNLGTFDVFIESTSVNRKLSKNSEVLYRIVF